MSGRFTTGRASAFAVRQYEGPDAGFYGVVLTAEPAAGEWTELHDVAGYEHETEFAFQPDTMRAVMDNYGRLVRVPRA